MTCIKLPATPAAVLHEVIEPAAGLLPYRLDSDRARLLGLAIMIQETGLRTRIQYVIGPERGAHGLAQFEKGGGVRGVLKHPRTVVLAADVCRQRHVAPTEAAVWDALLDDDLLAAAFTRLLLYTDRAPLPAVGNVKGAWAYYKRNWRPGKPRPDDWPESYALALGAIQEANHAHTGV